MSLKIDRIQLDIVINTNPARLELAKLDEKAAQLRKELRKLPEGSAEFIAKSKQLKEVVAAHDQIIQKLGVTGLTMKELGRRATELKAILRNLDPNSAQFKELDTQLKAVNARFAQLRGVNVQTGMSLSKLAEQTNRYIGLITMAAASITGMVLGVRKAIDAYAEWDDKLSDVMKTTGLSKTAVKELDAELKKINTRTSQMELLDLARVAGKLGITGKEDIAGFVRAANQIKVALTEDLGGNVEESINQLGKLSTIFKIDEKYGTEAALLKIGSAINSLGAASTANEGYLVEFSKRVAGVAPQAGISISIGNAATR
jgi:chromosome segregation ATPase